MELAQPSLADRRPSPGLALELPSNNPFRTRIPSPALPSPALPSPALPTPRTDPNNRPVSRNPFLAEFEAESLRAQQPSFGDMSVQAGRTSPKKLSAEDEAAQLFNSMALNNKAPVLNGTNGTNPFPAPQRSGTLLTQGHRPSRSDQEEQRLRAGPRGPPKPSQRLQELNIFASPERSENRRPRRNSESSMADKGSLTAEEEKKRMERRKDREMRAKDGRPRDGRPSTRPRKAQGLDLIDKLDVTGIYGPGLFHHDGPFDACNPHRNRRKDHRAPMQAFPANSANNALGGSGPLNKNIDLDQFHGRGTEGFTDYATTSAEPSYDPRKRRSVDRTIAFNPKDRGEIVHGEESIGLGTSTFLEGAPASRTAMQRRESETETQAFQNAGGITRKKSLAQRIRGISQPRRGFGEPGLIRSPSTRYEVRPAGGEPGSPPYNGGPLRSGPQTTGGMKVYEKNPFFDDYDEAYEKKGASIKVAEAEKEMASRARAPSSPMRGFELERRVTADNGAPAEQKTGGGFLSRVKSLKGGRRSRPERRE